MFPDFFLILFTYIHSCAQLEKYTVLFLQSLFLFVPSCDIFIKKKKKKFKK